MLVLLTIVNLVIMLILHGNADKLGEKDAGEYVLRNNFEVIYGVATLNPAFEGGGAENMTLTSWQIPFPQGLNKDNCVCISYEGNFAPGSRGYSNGTGFDNTLGSATGNVPRHITLGTPLDNSLINLQAGNISTSNKTFYYKIVLMKISNEDYILGDVNGDGVINKADSDLVLEYIAGNTDLTSKQFMAADVDKNGIVNEIDAAKILNKNF